jgi:copper chaperone
MKETFTVTINGMHCGACVRRVTEALNRLDGVEVNSVEVGSARVIVDSREKSADLVTSALSRFGFTAEVQE